MFLHFIQSMLLAYIDSIEPLVASAHAQMQMRLKSDTQQPTPDKDKGERDINVSEAISEGPSSIASASAISQHGPRILTRQASSLKSLYSDTNILSKYIPSLQKKFRSHYGSKVPAVTVTVFKYRNNIGKIVVKAVPYSVT
jgi:hypothetical protein